jgi:hypothetical protein
MEQNYIIVLTQLIGPEDENDTAQFPIEMFCNHHFSGLLPHTLVLKIGVVLFRFDLSQQKTLLGLTIKRRQFPVMLSQLINLKGKAINM